MEQSKLDRDQATRDRAQVRLDRAQAARDRMQTNRDRIQADHDRTQTDDLLREMQKDGLIKDTDHYQIKLTARSLVIDGQEQPQKVLRKYLKLHESSTGRKLTGNNAMVITRSSDSSTIINGVPAPPRPPRAPRAPLAAPAPPAPPTAALPAPPAPPRIDSESLRSELRKDGVIGAGDKEFQLQLSNSGLTVNGKKQPDELAAKYRRLTGHADDKNFNVTISTQE